MEHLYSVIKPEDIRRYVDVNKLTAEMCLHLAQDSFFLIEKLDAYHFGKLKISDYKRHFRGDEDIHQMWGNVMSAVDRIRKEDPSLIGKVPEAFLPGGKFFNHPSTWRK